MVATLAGMVTLVKSTQPANDTSPMLVNWLFSPNVTLVKLVQLRKADDPMVVTLSGMVTLVKLVQLRKADDPMVVTLEGMVMLVKLLLP